MLAKLIVNSHRIFIEIGLWLSLLFFLVVGWHFPILMGEEFMSQSGDGLFSLASISGIKGAIVGAIAWFLSAVVFFGQLLILGDIRIRIRNIEKRLNSGDKNDLKRQQM